MDTPDSFAQLTPRTQAALQRVFLLVMEKTF
jgi:hypothetical protein